MAGTLGRWDYVLTQRPPAMLGPRYDGPQPICLSKTYELAAAWLADCALVEDWGCGLGWARTLFRPEQYQGIDGSQTPYADQIADLTCYRSWVPGILMRHVLEHNDDWPSLLDNAVASFSRRMALVLFTPMDTYTHRIGPSNAPWVDAPNISFRHEDLVARFGGASFRAEDVDGGGYYDRERIYYLEKP